MDQQKLAFIQNGFIPLLRTLSPGARPAWGKMNPQQMVEHLTVFFKVSSGKIDHPLLTPGEHLPKYREFLLSDKPFKENTKAPAAVVPEEPLPVKHSAMEEAIHELEQEITDFVLFFNESSAIRTTHVAFGDLNFEEWVLLHYKHITHHLRQFGLI